MNDKKKFRIFLVLLLLGITLGYAVLGANLTINGNSKLASSTWDIHFENVIPKTGSVAIGTGDSAATITQGDDTEVTYAVTLSKPGDFYEFEVDAVNDGSVDGMVNTITSSYTIGNGEPVIITSSNLPAYLSYSATYSDGKAIAQNHLLKAGESETYKVRIEFKKDIENNQLPSTEQTIAYNFAVNYIQADDNAQEVNHPRNVYTVNIWDEDYDTLTTKTNNSRVWMGRGFTNNITQYNSAQDAMNAFKLATENVDRLYYLKHVVDNDIITDSYVEFIITPEMVEDNPGMVAGTYTLRGAGGTNCGFDDNNWPCDTDSPYYETNSNIIKTAFGYNTHPERCHIYNMYSQGGHETMNVLCEIPGLIDAATNEKGFAAAGGGEGSWECVVYPDGSSGCNAT